MKNDQLGYYSRGLAYGAISTTIEKDSKGMYWWGKCYNGNGIYRFKSTDIVSDYKTAKAPYGIILKDVKFKAFTIDEARKSLYVGVGATATDSMLSIACRQRDCRQERLLERPRLPHDG